MRESRREYSRVKVSWPVSILTRRRLIFGEIKNISLSGALIRCQELPSPEESLKLRIEIADLLTVSATVESTRFNVDDNHSGSMTYHLAVRFKEITEDERRILHNAIGQEVRKENH